MTLREGLTRLASYRRQGRRLAAILALPTLSLMLVLPAQAWAARGETLLVSRAGGLSGAGGNDVSADASVSADGRFVAFRSRADNLSTAQSGFLNKIFVRDTRTGATTQASITFDNSAGADADSFEPSVSADGRFVAFQSDADNLSTGDNNSFTNIFRRDLQASTTTLASVTFDNSAGANDFSFTPSISADGRFVAFSSFADNLSTGDNNSFQNIFVRDLQASTTTLASITFDNSAGGNDNSFFSGDSATDRSISADGRFVAFLSLADNLSTEDNNAFSNVFRRDTQAGATTLVSRAGGLAGTGADGSSDGVSISADGRFVAFSSSADNLSTADNNSFENIFVRDIQAGTTTLVSRSDVAGADDHSFDPSISADGRFVAFQSGADNLSTADNNSFDNVFVRDIQAGTTTLVSQANGTAADANSFDPSISADGRFVGFGSLADNLSTEDDNSVANVFRHDALGPRPECSNVAQTVAHDTATTVRLPCSDADGDPITRSIVSGPGHGRLLAVNQSAGTVTYTPDPGYSGPDSFSFRAADAIGASTSATASLTVAGPSPGSGLLPGRCANLLRGTNSGETLIGTRAGDRILGLGGNDVLEGLRGDDCLEGGRGRDRLLGGSGRDRLGGSSGRDRLGGSSGRDRLSGNSGGDRLSGNSGNDRLSGGSGRDRLSGGSGRDRLNGGKSKDSFNAGSGNDRINSADGRRERVRCGKGTDRVKADPDDVLSGCERVRRV